MRRALAVAVLLFLPYVARAQESKGAVLVITASARDYLLGAGGTIARLIDEGRSVCVLQFGNDEKDSAGLGPAQTREANNIEAERAAKVLGAREVLNLGHKSGELGYVSTPAVAP
jgi:LmbE family N-acetylglucosaminyl deacetylase